MILKFSVVTNKRKFELNNMYRAHSFYPVGRTGQLKAEMLTEPELIDQ